MSNEETVKAIKTLTHALLDIKWGDELLGKLKESEQPKIIFDVINEHDAKHVPTVIQSTSQTRETLIRK
jgi:hypothetical protein